MHVILEILREIFLAIINQSVIISTTRHKLVLRKHSKHVEGSTWPLPHKFQDTRPKLKGLA